MYGGGSGSGSSVIGVTNSVCSSSGPNAFGGGSAGGHSSVNITNSVCSAGGPNPFGGGSGGGDSRIGVTNSVCSASGPNPFGGGSADGGSSVAITNSVCSSSGPNPFAGGNAGGYSSVAEIVLDYASCVTLPIELLYFEGFLEADQVALRWKTKSETNNEYFTVERSQDGQDFEEVVRISGAGDSNEELSYQAVDELPYIGQSFYRLKQTDFNGDFSYSPYVMIFYEIDLQTVLSVYPNPVTEDYFFLSASRSVCENLEIQITDVSGQIVMNSTVCVDQKSTFPIAFGSQARGVYIVTVSCGNFSSAWKLLKN